MVAEFKPLLKLLEQAAGEGRSHRFWWRDDDAQTGGPELNRLLGFSRRYRAPIVLAVIPDQAEASVLSGKNTDLATVVQHGVDHQPRQPSGKKTEFPGDRDAEESAAAIAGGRDRLSALFGDRFLPVFVPPWNRMDEIHHQRLVSLGFQGFSGYGPRGDKQSAGLLEVNTHIDPIDWRQEKRFLGADFVIGQLVKHLSDKKDGQADPDEPTGLLTHHLVQDEASWVFIEELLETLSAHPGATWVAPFNP